MGRALDVATRFYEATSNRDLDSLRALVSEDVTFAGPLMKADGAQEYVAMNEQLLGFHEGTRMLCQLENGDDVCSVYELDMTKPSGGSLTLVLADWLRVKDGKIGAQRIFFDPREFEQAFGLESRAARS